MFVTQLHLMVTLSLKFILTNNTNTPKKKIAGIISSFPKIKAAGYLKIMSKKLKIENDAPLFNAAIHGIFLIVAGLVLPAVLIPIVKITNYSEIVEEIAKALIVLLLILRLPSLKLRLAGAIAFGFLFGLSENFLYLNQIFQFGDFSVLWQRFLWTVPMHFTTVLVMTLAGMGKKWFLILGLIGAVILHMLFNSLIVNTPII